VNPNQPGCDFPSKALAGVGVMFYVMLALRAELRRRGAYANAAGTQPRRPARPGGAGHGRRRGPLDRNNRILVARAWRASAAAAAARHAALLPSPAATRRGRHLRPRLHAIGPRLNAAGRLADMSLGIECLITDDPAAP
jgi:single-stranded-DNA-specific exonuclease